VGQATGRSISSENTDAEDENEYSQGAEGEMPNISNAIGPPATDSGYASIGRSQEARKDEEQDDAKTMFTDNQDLEIPDDVKEKLISAFSGELTLRLQGTLGRVGDRAAVWNTLADLLKEFSIRLRISASADEQKKAVTFVRHYRK
jgi:hypothetical protein